MMTLSSPIFSERMSVPLARMSKNPPVITPRIRSPWKLKLNVELSARIAAPKILSSGPNRASATLLAPPIRVEASASSGSAIEKAAKRWDV